MDRSAHDEASLPAGLRANHLSAWEAIGQSLATLAPTAGPAVIIPLALATSGNGTWLVFVIATIAIICIGYQINTFARRSSSPGSLYTFVQQGLPPASIVTAWALLIAYVATASGTACGAAIYLQPLLFPGMVVTRTGTLGLAMFAVAMATALAWFDVKISTRLMLALEGLAVLLMVLLYALPGHASAWHIDHAQLTLAGVTAKQIRGGLVLGVFAFVGFESAASLGGEVANPLRNIPRAISSSILIGGLFFIVSAYAEQIAFGANSSTLATSTAPLKLLAAIRGYPAFGPLLMTWCCVSAVACVAACIQAAARTLYGMSCNGQCAAILGRIHPRRHSPHIAILATTAAIALPAAALILLGLRLFDVYNWLATFATLGFITAYALVTIAAVRVQITLRTFGILSAITAAVIACVLALGAASSFDPSLTGVDRLLPYLYLLALAAGVLLTIAQRRPTQVS